MIGQGDYEHQGVYDEPDPRGVHRTHCCPRHGCMYGYDTCPVEQGDVVQEFQCEWYHREEDELERYDTDQLIAELVRRGELARTDQLKLDAIRELANERQAKLGREDFSAYMLVSDVLHILNEDR